MLLTEWNGIGGCSGYEYPGKAVDRHGSSVKKGGDCKRKRADCKNIGRQTKVSSSKKK